MAKTGRKRWNFWRRSLGKWLFLNRELGENAQKDAVILRRDKQKEWENENLAWNLLFIWANMRRVFHRRPNRSEEMRPIAV